MKHKCEKIKVKVLTEKDLQEIQSSLEKEIKEKINTLTVEEINHMLINTENVKE